MRIKRLIKEINKLDNSDLLGMKQVVIGEVLKRGL